MREVVVARRTEETSNIVSFDLIDGQGATLPPFSAGAHVDVRLGNGLQRQYSLYGSPLDQSRYSIAVLREPESRGGSRYIHEGVRVGDKLTISEPRNLFPLVPQAQKSVLIAGGIGITPILSMAEALSIANADFELHYCGRSEGQVAFVDRIRNSTFGQKSRVYFDDAGPQQLIDVADIVRRQPSNSHIYVCGPTGFIKHVMTTAEAAGFDPARLHREFFTNEPQGGLSGTAFELLLQKSGKIVRVQENQTAAAALVEAGVEVDLSCEQGICGTCLTRVVEGTPDHRDAFLTEREHAANDCFTPCCSRALTSRLVLDL